MNMDFVNHTVLFNNVTKSQSLRKKNHDSVGTGFLSNESSC